MIAADHPLASLHATAIEDSPLAAGEALESLGWIDDDGQAGTPRVAQGVDDVAPGTPLTLSLLFASESSERELAQGIADDLERCGVEITLENVPAELLYAPWPDGPAFGRDFDLVLWPWLGWVSPACELFTTDEIASATNREGSNASGFSDAAYDAACARLRLGPFAGEAYAETVRESQEILDQSLPSLPLLQWPRLLIAGRAVCGLSVDATAPLLWNLEEITRGPGCPS
jgi:peptide/nickel transport system substrate-binding protein